MSRPISNSTCCRLLVDLLIYFKGTKYSSLQLASPLQELTCHNIMGSHSVTCHMAVVTFWTLPQPKLVLDLVTPER